MYGFMYCQAKHWIGDSYLHCFTWDQENPQTNSIGLPAGLCPCGVLETLPAIVVCSQMRKLIKLYQHQLNIKVLLTLV